MPHLLCCTNMILHDIDYPNILHENSLSTNVRDYKEEKKFDIIAMNPPFGGKEEEGIKMNFPAEFRTAETADLFMTLIMHRLKRDGKAGVVIPDGFLFGTDNAKVAIKNRLFTEFNLHTIIRLPKSIFAPYTSITTNILFFDNSEPTKETWFYRLDMPKGYKNFSKTKPMKAEHYADAIKWWENKEEIEIDGFYKAKKYTVDEIKERNFDIDLCGYPHIEEVILEPKEFIKEYQEKRSSLNADMDRLIDKITDILGLEV